MELQVNQEDGDVSITQEDDDGELCIPQAHTLVNSVPVEEDEFTVEVEGKVYLQTGKHFVNFISKGSSNVKVTEVTSDAPARRQ